MHRELLDFPENCNGSERRGIASLVTLTRYWEIRFDTEIQSELKKKTFYLDRKIITVKRHLITHKKQGTVADRWHRDPMALERGTTGAGHGAWNAICHVDELLHLGMWVDLIHRNSFLIWIDEPVLWECIAYHDFVTSLMMLLLMLSETLSRLPLNGMTPKSGHRVEQLSSPMTLMKCYCSCIFVSRYNLQAVYLYFCTGIHFSWAYSGVTIIWVERFKSVFQQCLGALTRVRDWSFDTNSHSRACSRAFNQRCIRFINCTLSFTPERTGTHMSVWDFGEIFDFARRCRFCVTQLPMCSENDEWCSFFPSCANWFLSISMAGNVSIFLLLQLTYYFSIFSCRVCSRNSYIIRTTFSHPF